MTEHDFSPDALAEHYSDYSTEEVKKKLNATQLQKLAEIEKREAKKEARTKRLYLAAVEFLNSSKPRRVAILTGGLSDNSDMM
jgi:hypothetical protein